MTTEIINPNELFTQLDKETSNFLELILSADEKLFDEVPFKDSWTIAQLVSHVTKSNKAIAQALNMPGETAKRNADERVDELKKMFLDFETKYKSPEFILPIKEIYPKYDVVKKYEQSVEQLKSISANTKLSDVINLPAFGEITKFELLNFVVFHTRRHVRQLKNIIHKLQPKFKLV